MGQPARASRVFFFACNVDPSGARPIPELPPVVLRCLHCHKMDYAALSATPADFDSFHKAVRLMMATQPNYTAANLAAITVPVTIAQSAGDEFITIEHAHYLAKSLPNTRLVLLEGVSHFATLQRPETFNRAMLDFLSAD